MIMITLVLLLFTGNLCAQSSVFSYSETTIKGSPLVQVFTCEDFTQSFITGDIFYGDDNLSNCKNIAFLSTRGRFLQNLKDILFECTGSPSRVAIFVSGDIAHSYAVRCTKGALASPAKEHGNIPKTKIAECRGIGEVTPATFMHIVAQKYIKDNPTVIPKFSKTISLDDAVALLTGNGVDVAHCDFEEDIGKSSLLGVAAAGGKRNCPVYVVASRFNDCTGVTHKIALDMYANALFDKVGPGTSSTYKTSYGVDFAYGTTVGATFVVASCICVDKEIVQDAMDDILTNLEIPLDVADATAKRIQQKDRATQLTTTNQLLKAGVDYLKGMVLNSDSEILTITDLESAVVDMISCTQPRKHASKQSTWQNEHKIAKNSVLPVRVSHIYDENRHSSPEKLVVRDHVPDPIVYIMERPQAVKSPLFASVLRLATKKILENKSNKAELVRINKDMCAIVFTRYADKKQAAKQFNGALTFLKKQSTDKSTKETILDDFAQHGDFWVAEDSKDSLDLLEKSSNNQIATAMQTIATTPVLRVEGE